MKKQGRPPGKNHIRRNISLPIKLDRQLTETCKTRDLKKSHVISKALKTELEKTEDDKANNPE